MSSNDSPTPPTSNPFATGRSLILLQLLSRLLTFALNQSLVRLAPPEVFGTAAIQFDLISATILFLSREGIRYALLRGGSSSATSDGTASVAGDKEGNAGSGPHGRDGAFASSTHDIASKTKQDQRDALARLPLVLGIAVAAITTTIYLYSSSPTTTSQPCFHPALGLYILAALFELLIEPLYIQALRSDPPRLRVRVQAEGGMAIVKSLVTFGTLVVMPERALLGFAVGKCCGAGWLAGRYLWEYGWEAVMPQMIKQADPTHSGSDFSTYDPTTHSLAMANTRQSVIKHFLTEADRIAIGRISPLSDQGGYAVAMNYGSLIARILFQPLEETLLLHFSSSLQSPSPSSVISAFNQFSYIIHLSLYLLLLLPAFVPPLLPALIPLLLPRRYLATSAPTALQTYLTWYIPLLGLNGILEAFHASSATSQQVQRQARFMIASSACFAGVLYLLTRPVVNRSSWVGMTTEQSLIVASCLAVVMRMGYAFRHAQVYFALRGKRLRIEGVLPHIAVIGSSVVSGGVLRVLKAKERWPASWSGWAELIGAGGLVGLTTLGIMWMAEGPRLKELQRTMKGKAE